LTAQSIQPAECEWFLTAVVSKNLVWVGLCFVREVKKR
jgi:hypothetical protein